MISARTTIFRREFGFIGMRSTINFWSSNHTENEAQSILEQDKSI